MDPNRAAYSKKWRIAKGLLGLCSCGKYSHEPGLKTCKPCLDRRTASFKESKRLRMKNGICARCGKIPTCDGQWCSSCLERGRTWRKSRPGYKPMVKIRAPISERKKSGLCLYCAEPAIKLLCETCSDKTRCKKYKMSPADLISLREYSMQCHSCGDSFESSSEEHIDHNHQTGKVRGLLCRACNLALGHLKEDSSRIEKLLSYVERTDKKS